MFLHYIPASIPHCYEEAIDGKVSAIATGLYCAPEEWDTKKGEAKNASHLGGIHAVLAVVLTARQEFHFFSIFRMIQYT